MSANNTDVQVDGRAPIPAREVVERYCGPATTRHSEVVTTSMKVGTGEQIERPGQRPIELWHVVIVWSRFGGEPWRLRCELHGDVTGTDNDDSDVVVVQGDGGREWLRILADVYHPDEVSR